MTAEESSTDSSTLPFVYICQSMNTAQGSFAITPKDIAYRVLWSVYEK